MRPGGRWWLALLAAGLLMQPAGAVKQVSVNTTVFAKPGDCGDFLTRLRRKPPRLVYEGCRYLPDNQGKPLVATYRVAGRNAALVARALTRTFGMNPVNRYCCQWEALRSEFTDARRQHYSILMVSEETIHLTRDAWPQIERFEVQVETWTEEV